MAGKEKTIQKATLVALGKLIDLARASDPSALKTLSEYGLNPGRAGVFRFISEGEANNILNGGRYLGRFGDGRVDVTSNDAVTTGLSDAFRVLYKPEFDLYKGGDRVRLKNEELGDGWLLGGYDLNDVAAIFKKLQDGTYKAIYDSSIIRTVQDNGKIRLSLPTHTAERPRQFVLEPAGDNKFYIHMRTWDGDHIPANLSFGDKQVLFNALYNELPEGAEILFPKSGPGNYATRGTVAGLQRLARDSRFTPGTKGILLYLDKDGKVKTYEGTSFIKSPQITQDNAASITPEQWAAAQDIAIAKGDMAEAQRLRDLHFKVSAPDTQIKDTQYHGAKGNAKFNIFDPKLIGQTDKGWAGKGYYFTPSIDYAKMYGSEPRAFYINAQKVHDGTAATYFGRENGPEANAFKIIRKRHGNDGQQILDELASSDAIRTSFPQTQPYNGRFEEVVTRNNNQMKLADAVTYDDNGVRIPLGKRDNFNTNDIRWVLVPTAAGLSIKAASDNTFDKPLYNPNSPIF